MTRIIKSLGCGLGKRLLGPGSEMSEKKCHQRAKFDFQRGMESAQSDSRAYLHSGKTMFAGPREASKISQTQTTLE